jgi:hypothetical protein
MLKVHLHCGNRHFLPSAEVFSNFDIASPMSGTQPQKAASGTDAFNLELLAVYAEAVKMQEK